MCALHDVLKTGSHYLGSNFNGTSSDSNGASTKLRFVATSNESAICKGCCFAPFQQDVWLCARYRKITGGNALQAWMAWPSCHNINECKWWTDCTSCSITRLPSVESTSPSQTVNKDRWVFQSCSTEHYKLWSNWHWNQNGRPSSKRIATAFGRDALLTMPSKRSSTSSG